MIVGSKQDVLAIRARDIFLNNHNSTTERFSYRGGGALAKDNKLSNRLS